MTGGPLVPWCRWPASSRAVEDLRSELGERAALAIITAPFAGWYGGIGQGPGGRGINPALIALCERGLGQLSLEL